MSDPSYSRRVNQRIERARKRGAQAMTLVGLVTLVFVVFLIYVLVVAIRLDEPEAVRAAWVGLTIIVVANGLSWALYRSQGRVLDKAMSDLSELLGPDQHVGDVGDSEERRQA